MRQAASAAALALVAAALLAGGGSGNSRLLWIGGLALVAAALAFALLPAARPGRAGLVLLGALAGLAVWDGSSIVWSVAPDLSWDATNRALVYLGFACLGFLAAASSRRLALGLTLALAATIGWALLTKVFPGLYPDYGRIARLRSPIGYWNALAQAGDALLPLGLWLFGRRRAAGAVLVYAAAVATVLTFSRSGIVFAVVAGVVYLALAREAVAGLLGLAAALPVAAAVLLYARTLPGIVDDGRPRSVRAHDGWEFALAFLVGAALVWLAGAWLARREVVPATGRRIVLGAGAAAVLAVVAAVVALSVHEGGPGKLASKAVHQFTNTPFQQIGQTSVRLSSLNSSNRWSWWKESWASFTHHPLDGSGAGSFFVEHRLVRHVFSQNAEEPHNLPLQFLGETGIVGFLLLVAIAGAGVAIVGSALRRDDRAAVAALAAGCLAYLLHTIVDLHWDYLAVSAPVFLVLGALAAPPRAREHKVGWLASAAALLLAATAVYSLASPYLASRKVDDAATAVDKGRIATARADARSARSLNPLSIDPLLLEGATAATLPDADAAYLKAVKLQPENPDAWEALGEFAFQTGRYRVAYDALNREYTLDRFNPSSAPGGLLDQARCKIDRSTCPAPRRRARPAGRKGAARPKAK